MKRDITFTIDVPVPATEDQILEWVRFELNEIASISASNPLHEYELEAEFGETTISYAY